MRTNGPNAIADVRARTAAYVRTARRARGLSQQAAAGALACSRRTYIRLEQTGDFEVGHLVLLAHALGLAPGRFLARIAETTALLALT